MNPQLPAWRASEHILTPGQLADLAGSWERRNTALAAIAREWDVDAAVRFLEQTTAKAHDFHEDHPAQTNSCPGGDVGESVRRHVTAAAIFRALPTAPSFPAAEGIRTTTDDKATGLWDPCTGIPDEALRASNVDAASRESGIAGIEQSGWKIGGWRGPVYAITVYSTARTVDQFENKPGNVDFADVTIAGRCGRRFRAAGASKHLNCNVVFPAQQGVIQLQLLIRAVLDNPPEPCGLLARIGEILVPWFPE